jgi:hypothetical protein
MSITIRKALESDAPLIAQALLENSRRDKKVGIFDYIFNTSDTASLLESLRKLTLTTTKSYCHFSNFMIAQTEGKSVGAICGYEPRIATHNIFARALEEVGIDESYHERIAGYLLCEPEIDNKTWVCEVMVIEPDYKSFELFKELIAKSLLTARLKGYRKVQTMLEIGSTESELLYKKLGFDLVDEKRSDYYEEQFGRAGLMRLQVTL